MKFKANQSKSFSGLITVLSSVLILVGVSTEIGFTEDSKTAKVSLKNADKIIFKHKLESGDLKLIENNNNETLVIENIGSSQYEIKQLENPSRLVVDINDFVVEVGDDQNVLTSKYVKQIRYGKHGNTGRIVLDLKIDGVTYQADSKNGILSLVLAIDDNKVGKIDTTEEIIKSDDIQVINSDEVLNEKEVEQSLDLSLTKAALENSKKQKTNDNLNKVTAIKLTSAKSENVLNINLNSPSKFALKRETPTEYGLTIKETVLADGVKNEILENKPRAAIKAVKAEQLDEDLKILIFVDVTKDLVATRQGDSIVVATTSLGSTKEFDIRAEGELNSDIVAEDLPATEGATTEPTVTLSSTPAIEATSDDMPSESDLSDLFGSDSRYTGRLISLDLQDTEIDNALRIIAEVSNLNIIASDDVTGKVTLRLIDVPWDQALDVILKTNNLDKVQEGNVVRIAPVEKLRAEREALRQAQQAEDELEPLRVQYIRISYAKAAELQPLVETVITERGSVAYDERSNQLIVKDISKGLKNVARLVQKLDLRTPQVLIETQIVEAQRTFIRDLGSELGFTYIRSPETGNALGYNFPNSVAIGGSAVDGASGTSVGPTASFFPSNNAASAVSALFSSADGTKSLNMRISAAEAEGRARIVSRPSVAVTNNSPAVIKSIEKLRVRIPQGGVSVATGQGSSAAGAGNVATEAIEIGIILNVTAQASPDYYVLLDINAKSSTLGPKADSIENIPPEIERSATSTVLVSSGQTFALGGIYRVTEKTDLSGVPFFKDIPVLGHFFRRTGVNDIDEELIFFITPRIIEGSFDDASMKAVSQQ
jgi:type IV pilus assembly protein PilQ